MDLKFSYMKKNQMGYDKFKLIPFHKRLPLLQIQAANH